MDPIPAIVERIQHRIETLSKFSEDGDAITRTFLSEPMRAVIQQSFMWLQDAGLHPSIDPIGNIIGRWESDNVEAKTLVLGSHLDTVRDAGKYDGILGFVLALGLIEFLQAEQISLPFHIEAVGFCDEEGIRFQTGYIGSAYYTGTFDPAWLSLTDRNGMTMESALASWGHARELVLKGNRPRPGLLAYIETHIEQGPVLEELGRGIGVVQAIVGQTRVAITLDGKSGHAGTTPMAYRRDALAGAAEFIAATEACAQARDGLLATVGALSIRPNASNVIPGHASLSLDVRAENNEARRRALGELRATLDGITERRDLSLTWTVRSEEDTVACDPDLIKHLAAAVPGSNPPILVSGAGHDAVQMSNAAPVGMLFVRCRDGLSHHPDEHVETADIEEALHTLIRFIRAQAERQ